MLLESQPSSTQTAVQPLLQPTLSRTVEQLKAEERRLVRGTLTPYPGVEAQLVERRQRLRAVQKLILELNIAENETSDELPVPVII